MLIKICTTYISFMYYCFCNNLFTTIKQLQLRKIYKKKKKKNNNIYIYNLFNVCAILILF